MSFSYINPFILITILPWILASLYPKNKNITNLPKTDERTISIRSKNEINQYIDNSDYIIAMFHQDWCGHCRHFLPVFKQASSYKLVNKFQFLEINCANKEICDMYNIDRFPTIKIIVDGSEIKGDTPRELEPLLEYLEKLSTNPIIPITNKSDFYNAYGTFSPYVEYNNKNKEFYNCIAKWSKGEFKQFFYFGVKEINDNNEKIIFDYDGLNTEYTWDGNCANVEGFWYKNKYPLINEINSPFIKKVMKEGWIVSMLFYDDENVQQKEFVMKGYKNISFKNRQIVFGFADGVKEEQLVKYFKINYRSGMQLLIHDFGKDVYYLHPVEFNDLKDARKVEDEIEDLIKNYGKLRFTTGSIFKDLWMKIGMSKVIPYLKYVIIGVFLLILFIAILFVIWCDNPEEDMEGLNKDITAGNGMKDKENVKEKEKEKGKEKEKEKKD